MNKKQMKDFLAALDAIVKEKGIDRQIIIEAMETAMANAYKKNEGVPTAKAKLNEDTGELKIYTYKTVVEEVEDEETQISLADARKIIDDIQIDETIDTEVKMIPENFGRVAVLSAKQIIVQKVKEAEKNLINDSKYRNSSEFFSEAFESDVELLVDAIREYKRIGNHTSEERYLAELLK